MTDLYAHDAQGRRVGRLDRFPTRTGVWYRLAEEPQAESDKPCSQCDGSGIKKGPKGGPSLEYGTPLENLCGSCGGTGIEPKQYQDHCEPCTRFHPEEPNYPDRCGNCGCGRDEHETNENA